VQFILTEDLRQQPNTVTGVTNQVAGDILVDLNTPANSKVGTIRIDARTLTTDSEFRNRAIRAEILESSKDEYEFIDFTPTAISGLPAQITVGQAVTFQITGDLKIRDITNSVTFDVTATVAAEDRLEGTATAQVTRAMYNLQIPNAPGVANVSDEVTLQIDFVATKVTQ
jgi:polyisoprenoid-binding protein YceI